MSAQYPESPMYSYPHTHMLAPTADPIITSNTQSTTILLVHPIPPLVRLLPHYTNITSVHTNVTSCPSTPISPLYTTIVYHPQSRSYTQYQSPAHYPISPSHQHPILTLSTPTTVYPIPVIAHTPHPVTPISSHTTLHT